MKRPKTVRVEKGSLVRFRPRVKLHLSTPMKVIEVKEDLVKLEDGIWWPITAVMSEQEWRSEDEEPA